MKYFVYILLLSIIISGCSNESADNIMETAKQNIEQKKFDEAVKLLEKLVTNYPESDLAPAALYETAYIYQNRYINNISETESLNRAASLFKRVYDEYPNSKEAAKSLFFAGFIKANDLKQYDEATELYSLFIEKFPKHELTSSAKIELDNMGIPAEDIIKKDTLAEK